MKKSNTSNDTSNEFFHGWPDSIIYEDKEIFCTSKEPHFAKYMMMVGGSMNRFISISRADLIKHNQNLCASE